MKDALLETAASVVACQIRQDNPVRMPLVGDRPMEYSSRMGLPVLLDELARCTFNETERFERVLMMQLAELRKTGAVVIITTRLTSALVDMIARMSAWAPTCGFTWLPCGGQPGNAAAGGQIAACRGRG